MDRKEVDRVLASVTASVPQAGKVLGFSERLAYEAVRNGSIPVIKLGASKSLVPTAWLREQLHIRDEAAPSVETQDAA